MLQIYRLLLMLNSLHIICILVDREIGSKITSMSIIVSFPGSLVHKSLRPRLVCIVK